MKLWIDDIRDAPDDSWTVARTVTEAIRLITKAQWDEISFDHDIEGSKETYEAVAHFLAWYYVANVSNRHVAPHFEPLVMIHSGNPIGARRIEGILKDAQMFPLIMPVTNKHLC
jgi:hypothetical protein